MKAHIIAKELNIQNMSRDLVSVLLKAEEISKNRLKGIYFIEGDGNERFQPYYELVESAKKILGGLKELKVRKGDKLVFQIKNEYYFVNLFWACIMGGIIPVPLTVSNTASTNSEAFAKLLNVLRQLSNPKIVTEYSLKDIFKEVAQENKELSIVFFEDIEKMSVESGEITTVVPQDLAFIQFSSGSTGSPKGVMLTHGNLTCNTASIISRLQIGENDFVGNWMPLTHDMGIICLHLTFVMAASNQFIMAPDLFIRRPMLFFEKVTKHKATFFGAPNFALAWLEEKVTQEKLSLINLSSIRTIINGAEPISMKVSRKFLNKYSVCNLKSSALIYAYGMAEASVGVTFPDVGEVQKSYRLDRKAFNFGNRIVEVDETAEDFIEFIEVGYPLNATEVQIVDDNYQLLDECMIGNIIIKGPNVTLGYFNNPEINKELFIKGFLKTGDLGFVKNNRLVITGRKKDVIFFNGQNYYAHDLERICEELDDIELGKVAACGVFNYNVGKEEILVFVQFRKKTESFLPIAEKTKEHINCKLGQPLTHVLPVQTIPKTTSGKLQRYKLGQQYLNGGFDDILPLLTRQDAEASDIADGAGLSGLRNNIDAHIFKLWSNVLKTKRIGIFDDFFRLGGNSIKMMQLISDLSRDYGLEISIKDFTALSNIANLSDFVSLNMNTATEFKFKAREADFDNMNEPFPLTDVQTAYLMGRSSSFEMGGVSTHGYYEFETKLDIARFNQSLQKVIKRQSMLRAVILPNGEQKILEDTPQYTIAVEDIRYLCREEQMELIMRERERMSHYIFKTDEWPLFEFKAYRITDETNYLFMSFDLLVVDGSSVRIMIKEVMDFYRNGDMKKPDIGFSFRDYVLACEEFQKHDIYSRDKKYWLDKLEEFPTSPELPLKKDPAQITFPNFERYQKVIGRREWEKIKEKAREKNVTPSALLCTVYSDILGFWSNQQHHAINVTIFTRYPFHEDINSIIGDFTSVMLVEADLKPELTIWDNTTLLQEKLMEALEHRHYDGVKFIRELSKHNNFGTKAVMPIVFTSLLFSDDADEEEGSLTDFGEIKMGISQTSQVYLDYQVSEVKGELTITWDFVKELFEEEVIDTMFKQYTKALKDLAATGTYEICASTADMELVRKYNDTKEDISLSMLHALFKEQVMKTPSNIAVEFGEKSITYLELDKQSNQIAHFLREGGVSRNNPVGVLAQRSIETIVNIFGILKAGGAYVPIDPEYPEDRRRYILENSDCKLLLKPELYAESGVDRYPTGEINMSENPEDLAYIIYTSGSTGRPKGVMITHGAASNTIQDINRKFGVVEDDKVIGLSSMCFDLSVYDIFGTLSVGGTLVMVSDLRDMNNVMEIVKKKKITVWNSVPAIMDMLIENIETEADEELPFWQMSYNPELLIDYSENDALRLVMLSGDWIPLGLPEKIRSSFPCADIISLGGATESSIWSIYYPIKEVKEIWKSIPYGIPLANQKFYVLNYKKEICPIGVQGELYIGGVGIAKGYMNDEEKTRNAFISHSKLGDLYRTGDYGVLHKGYIEFLGRKDQQIKIRGHRIELGEIESNLTKHTSVKNVAVIDRTDASGKKYLCAYIVSDERLNPQSLKEHLQKEVPEYMIPSVFVRMGKIPLTSNGKVDRKALPEPYTNNADVSDYVAPRNDIERELAETWQEVLGREKVGINDNFFDLGGDSLSAMRIYTKLRGLFTIGPNTIYENKTVAAIAKHITRKVENVVSKHVNKGECNFMAKHISMRPDMSVKHNRIREKI
ncbi:amino acid adenylation domain-containing protein [Anaerobacterium chartisolvens]|uniref:Amino acid adenylation domain-containing protein n=1 Tax=Anaerobacterium chartisolvens TaxID=1297424 RepID=A0A369B4S8_9FIRM|nr:non-ribosomal peptide synthetase [Anaerobacterium chartisolvens]RCX16519.1 amino acid adenylation domain-containing protein [Anaerobacterium chartisolvens]